MSGEILWTIVAALCIFSPLLFVAFWIVNDSICAYKSRQTDHAVLDFESFLKFYNFRPSWWGLHDKGTVVLHKSPFTKYQFKGLDRVRYRLWRYRKNRADARKEKIAKDVDGLRVLTELMREEIKKDKAVHERMLQEKIKKNEQEKESARKIWEEAARNLSSHDPDEMAEHVRDLNELLRQIFEVRQNEEETH